MFRLRHHLNPFFEHAYQIIVFILVHFVVVSGPEILVDVVHHTKLFEHCPRNLKFDGILADLDASLSFLGDKIMHNETVKSYQV